MSAGPTLPNAGESTDTSGENEPSGTSGGVDPSGISAASESATSTTTTSTSTSDETTSDGEMDAGSSSSGEDSTASDSDSDTTTGDAPATPAAGQPAHGMWAHCDNADEEQLFPNCINGASVCVYTSSPSADDGFCTALGCSNAALDCDPVPSDSDATTACSDDGAGATFCTLNCTSGVTTCPAGMVCNVVSFDGVNNVEMCM